MNMLINILEFEKLLKEIVPSGLLSLPLLSKFGHVSFNGLFINKESKENLLNLLNSLDYVDRYEIVNNFLNIFFKKDILFSIDFTDIGKGEKINLEYCSPNPTGYLHLGHFRNIILGFALSNLLRLTNYDITTEMYINDQGNQMNQFLETIKHYKNPEKDYKIYYKGDYVQEIGKEITGEITNKTVVPVILNKVYNTLKKMNVYHDVISMESDMYADLQVIQKILEEKNLLYYGKLENQKAEGDQLILKTSELGLDYDSVLQRNDGTYTYYAFDLAYHYNKLNRGFKNQIIVLAVDHAQHSEKLMSVLNTIFGINLKVFEYEMFHLIENNQIIAMSKREGTIINIDEMLEKMDLDYLKWIILSQNTGKVIHFNLDSISTNNPIFLFKYVFMRLNQITVNNSNSYSIDPNIYNEVFRRTLFFPIVLRDSVKNFDSHKILHFTFDLCENLNKFLGQIVENSVTENDFILLQKSKFILDFASKIIDIKL